MTASPGDGEHAAREGYYPDPSIPGYVRFWNGLNWVPGTSRPAVAADETGPVFLDETGVTEALREPERWPEPEPQPERAPAPAPETAPDPAPGPVVWQADPFHQSGFGGPRDDRVSWGHEPPAAARSAGISLARTPVPAPAPAHAAAPAPAHAPLPAPVHAPLPAQVSGSGSRAAEGVGILSARSPVREAPAPAPLWPAPAVPAEPVRRAAPAEQARAWDNVDIGMGMDMGVDMGRDVDREVDVDLDADRAAHAAPAPSAKLADRARRPVPAAPAAP
ncbi:DUF2510 domain-containing protein, partial [Streptomyces sp. ISL-66]|uniref:DUF2510 domain-containing protein n=1 Tax=Streptomyces sp. ISL-66 TaxID=2819186 RepID=UPI0020355C2C